MIPQLHLGNVTPQFQLEDDNVMGNIFGQLEFEPSVRTKNKPQSRESLQSTGQFSSLRSIAKKKQTNTGTDQMAARMTSQGTKATPNIAPTNLFTMKPQSRESLQSTGQFSELPIKKQINTGTDQMAARMASQGIKATPNIAPTNLFTIKEEHIF